MSVVNKRELAELVGKSERTITKWQKNGMPVFIDGTRGNENQYSTEDVIDWMIKREVERVVGDGFSEDGEYHDPEKELANLRKHQARKAKVEADLAEGLVLDAEEVQLAMGKLDTEVRTAMLALPSRMAPTLIGLKTVREIRVALKSDVLTALDGIATSNDSDDKESPPGET